MATKCGRPPKSTEAGNTKDKIIAASVEVIKKYGADRVTVRHICEEAGISIGTFYHHFENKDDLLIYFVKELSFDSVKLETPVKEISNRICELYMHLINRYLELGEQFMKSFYTTGNKALSAYMGQGDGAFPSDTVMARCEQEIIEAIRLKVLKGNTDAHMLSVDICTIVKGCVFEWSLSDGDMDIESTVYRIIGDYMSSYYNTDC